MKAFLPWLYIMLSVFIYIIIALSTSYIIKKSGKDLKIMATRHSRTVLLIGAIGNLLILISILLLIKVQNLFSINSLGYALSGQDILFTIEALVGIVLLSLLFIKIWQSAGNTKVKVKKPIFNSKEAFRVFEALFVLLIVAVQEEVLFRGYITLNLIGYNPLLIISVTTLIFSAIHLLTNKSSLYQIISWLLGGFIFAYIYLATASILIAIIIHFAADAINMLIFDIVGKYSFFDFTPRLNVKQRTAFRFGFTVLLLVMIFVFYGSNLKLG